MSQEKHERKRIFSPNHADPGEFWLDYILLPYGEFYEKTKVFLNAKKGDTIHFYNGGNFVIDSVTKIVGWRSCDVLCRIRYGFSWEAAFQRWLRYARMEGHGKDILSREECLLIIFERKNGADSM